MISHAQIAAGEFIFDLYSPFALCACTKRSSHVAGCPNAAVHDVVTTMPLSKYQWL